MSVMTDAEVTELIGRLTRNAEAIRGWPFPYTLVRYLVEQERMKR